MKLFANDYEYTNIRWFIIIDAYYKHPADAIYCIGYNENREIICQWEIPIEGSIVLLHDTEDNKPKAIELPKPTATIKQLVNKQITRAS
jgi:hypothetical protein